ncbi:hypothetical protein [Halocalculus aciditolerans]|uniref:Uncharacterized protein n=1 Tax=Halocalculus aciditolerans TaxID=1383812 RepID=A0A830EZP9_9EURY|nr:hypothetical protein [Halocalculus aciditolerans]GGL48348.1 hypothetical protein GCM10009039_03190 [Halocalculus aciditolerans]
MVTSTRGVWDVLAGYFERTYDDAVVYGDRESETVLHEGEVRVLANGWVELPTGRLLSPDAVHHVDPVTEA